jgi:hypothetical protein
LRHREAEPDQLIKNRAESGNEEEGEIERHGVWKPEYSPLQRGEAGAVSIRAPGDGPRTSG